MYVLQPGGVSAPVVFYFILYRGTDAQRSHQTTLAWILIRMGADRIIMLWVVPADSIPQASWHHLATRRSNE